MKITVNQLRKVIKEETKKVVSEMHEDDAGLTEQEFNFIGMCEGLASQDDETGQLSVDLEEAKDLILGNLQAFAGCLRKGAISGKINLEADTGGHSYR